MGLYERFLPRLGRPRAASKFLSGNKGELHGAALKLVSGNREHERGLKMLGHVSAGQVDTPRKGHPVASGPAPCATGCPAGCFRSGAATRSDAYRCCWSAAQ